jgi:hypothetical protein
MYLNNKDQTSHLSIFGIPPAMPMMDSGDNFRNEDSNEYHHMQYGVGGGSGAMMGMGMMNPPASPYQHHY